MECVGAGERATDATPRSSTRRWGVADAATGVVLVLVALAWWGWLVRTVVIDPSVQVFASYLLVWVPLLTVCVIATTLRGQRSFVRDFGLRITFIDLLLGIGVGLLIRVLVSVIEIAMFGRMSGLGVRIEVSDDLWWIFGFVVAPVLIAPFVEELYFRGMTQRAVARGVSSRSSAFARGATAILVSAAVFALMHTAELTSPIGGLVVGISAFIFGVGSGVIAQLTGRIGGSIVAHATFNASLVLLVVTQ